MESVGQTERKTQDLAVKAFRDTVCPIGQAENLPESHCDLWRFWQCSVIAQWSIELIARIAPERAPASYINGFRDEVVVRHPAYSLKNSVVPKSTILRSRCFGFLRRLPMRTFCRRFRTHPAVGRHPDECPRSTASLRAVLGFLAFVV